MHVTIACMKQLEYVMDGAFEFYLLTEGASQFMISADSIIENALYRFYPWFLNFLSNRESWDCFLWPDPYRKSYMGSIL